MDINDIEKADINIQFAHTDISTVLTVEDFKIVIEHE